MLLWVGCSIGSKQLSVQPEPPISPAEESKDQSLSVQEGVRAHKEVTSVGKPVTSAVEAQHTQEEMVLQMKTLFPEDNVIPGWRKSKEISLFQPHNLYEHIDGAAEAFLAYGFQLCGTTDYISDSLPDEFIRVDIYNMEKDIQAFGMYASERYPGQEIINVGTQGYVEPSVLNFWKGPYYVKIAGSAPTEDIAEASMKIAKYIDHKISAKAEKPLMLSLLPTEGLVFGTERFILSNILGYQFLENGVSATYQVDNENKPLIIMEYSSIEDAKDILAKLMRHEEGSGEVIGTANLGDDGFIANDRYYKRIIAVRLGRYLIVTPTVTNESSTLELLRNAINTISKASNAK